MIGDLHCHTRLSNGSCGIDDVVSYAKRAGLSFVALTDQDTMDGVVRAGVLGKRYGIRVIAGVELSCRDEKRGRQVHLLCYLPETPDRMQGLMARTLESRTAAGKEMIRRVMRFYPVTEEHILRYSQGSKSIYQAHILQALFDLGYGSGSYHALQDKLFGPEGICLVEPVLPDIYSVLDLVHSAGGLAVLAHPGQDADIQLLEELCATGLLQGVEVYHPRVSGTAADTLSGIARQYQLLETGGSGFHGCWTGEPNPIASRVVPQACISRMFQRKKALAIK